MSVMAWKRHFCPHRFAASAMIVFFMLTVSNTIAGRHPKSLVSETLAPVLTPLGISGRRLLRFPRGECIVLRPPIKLVGEEEKRQYLGTDEETDLVRHVLSPGSWWRIEPNRPEDLTTFNCATFAVGDVIGLSRADFVTPQAVSFTNMQNPAHILLQEFFDCLVTYPLAEIKWHELDHLESLRENDVVVFATHGSSEEYVHLGRIVKWQGGNRMLSKMGRGPIVRGTIQRTAQAYEGRFDEIQIYRRH